MNGEPDARPRFDMQSQLLQRGGAEAMTGYVGVQGQDEPARLGPLAKIIGSHSLSPFHPRDSGRVTGGERVPESCRPALT